MHGRCQVSDCWTSPVAAWLRGGGYARFETDNFTRIALLPEIVRELLPGDQRIAELADNYGALMTLLSHLSADTFASRRTPFLMTSANRALAMAAAGDRDALGPSLAVTALQVFDSFYDDLPSGTTVALDPDLIGGPVHLIARGVKLSLLGLDPVRIVKTTVDRMTVEGLGGSHEITFAQTSDALQHAIRTLPVSAGFVLLVESGPTLFEPEYAFKVYPEILNPEQLATMISDSIEIIFTVWPALREPFARTLRYFVPIRQSEARTHNSFSAQSTVGVIFLSEAYDDLKLVEAIVHEFHHNELYMYMQVVDLLSEGSRDMLYYSPWRPDARPLFGLLHGCYVFTAVAYYLRAAEGCAADPGLARYFSRGREQVVERLGWALAQIRETDVTSDGQVLVDWMRLELHGHLSDFDRTRLAARSAELSEHLYNWCCTHPELAPSVRTPQFI